MARIRNLAVADCETDPFKIGRVPKPFLWGYYNGEKYFQFRSTAEFVKFLKGQGVIVYAHNGGKFDWHFLLEEAEEYSDVMIINGRIAKLQMGMAELRDSYSILPVPLKAYKKDEIDYAIFEEDKRHIPENWKKITEYLKSDCVYLYELISQFVDIYGVQITQASAAMGQWKKLSKQKVPASTKEFYERISPYYYGGRVECFESGIVDTNFNVFDINSAYPFAMLHEHPYSTDFLHFDKFVPNADFYRVRCISSGAFPYRGMGNPGEFAGLRFPNDFKVREYTITGWEFEVAKRTKTINNVHVLESFVFLEHTNFKQYIEYFYEMRLKAKVKGNEAESLFAKLLMNSLYGKFAANPENYRNYMIVPMDVIGGLEKTGWEFAGELGPWGLAQAPLEDEQLRYYNVATGASITGFVRAMLWEAIATSRGVLYCDTDSLTVRKPGSKIVLGEKLGQWKDEGRWNEKDIGFDKAGIGGKKLYILRSVPIHGTHAEFLKLKEKGENIQMVSRNGEKAIWRIFKTAAKGARLTNSQLWEVAEGKQVWFESDAPTFSVTKAPSFTKRRIQYTAERSE